MFAGSHILRAQDPARSRRCTEGKTWPQGREEGNDDAHRNWNGHEDEDEDGNRKGGVCGDNNRKDGEGEREPTKL